MSGFTLSALKNTLDEVRSQYYPKNETEKKVYEALSSKNWGASSTLLNDLASESMDYEKYKIITSVLWQFLETEGRTWKQIFKALTLIEFLIKNGSERFIEESRDKLYKIRSFQEFNFYEGTIEKASGIREKSRQIVELLGSNETIRSEREKARQLRNKFVGIDSRNSGYGGSDSYYGSGGSNYSSGGIGSGSGGGNDRGNERGGGRYSDSVGETSNRRVPSASDYNTGRYGGGAYDSDRPPRYGDDEHDDRRSFREEPKETRSNLSRYADDEPAEEPVAPKATTHRSKSVSGPVSATSTGGKLKVNIKKVSESTPAKAVAAEKNLLDTGDIDLIGGSSDAFDPFTSAPTSNSTAASFDPFSSNVAPAQTRNNTAAFDPFATPAAAPTQARNNAAAFDPFAAAPPAPSQSRNSSAGFDPFNTNNAPVAATNNFDQFGSAAHNPPAVTPQPTQAFDPFAAAPAPVIAGHNNAFPYNAPAAQPPVNAFPPSNNYQNNFAPAQPHHPNPSFPSSVPVAPVNTNHFNTFNGNNQFLQPNAAAQSFQQSPTGKSGQLGTVSHDAEFGDFEGPAQAQKQNNGPDKWGDLGKLVDLNKIEKNAALIAKQNAASNTNNNYSNSFAGLDGFSKTQQSMNTTSAIRPIGSYTPNPQPSNPMGARPLNPNPGFPGYGNAPPNYGAPLGNPGIPSYGAPIPGNYPPYGNAGFAPTGYPSAGTPLGNPGFGAPNPNYNPNVYNAGPNPNYGNPNAYGLPPRGW